MTIQSWLPFYQTLVELAIQDFFAKRYKNTSGIEKTYEEALRYAVEGGGKRLRPILTMLAYEHCRRVSREFWDTDDGESVLRAIIGVEFMHCYTLVHDDLPCMDNDELRRGKPTVWKAYGEPMALLIGDTLQTMSFELLSSAGESRAIWELARALGDMGVARGQVRDTFLRHDELSLDELLRIHDEKTGMLIAAALSIGVMLGHGDDITESKMRQLGMLLGRAFQIQDDILDAEGLDTTVGKKTKKDIALGKGIVSLIGMTEAKNMLQSLEGDMLGYTSSLDSRFSDIVSYIVHRES